MNAAIKANIADNERRTYIARHFAVNAEPDEKILGWAREYEEMEANKAAALAAATVSPEGLVSLDIRDMRVDHTSLMFGGYALGKVVHVAHDQGHSFGVHQKAGIDILAVLKDEGISCGGFALKANVANADADATVVAVLEYLRG